MSSSKYIVFKNGNFPEAVIFPETISHQTMMNKMVIGKTVEEKKTKVLGAGLISLGINAESEVTITVKGEATSIGVQSRIDDIRYLIIALGLDY